MCSDNQPNKRHLLYNVLTILITAIVTAGLTNLANRQTLTGELKNQKILIGKQFDTQRELLQQQIDGEYKKASELQVGQHIKNIILLKEEFQLQKKELGERLSEEFKNSLSIIEISKSQKT